MISEFKKVIINLQKKVSIDNQIVNQFLERTNLGLLTRNISPANHFCTFIVPFNSKTKQIFIGHHIKANQWIPPGGHMEENERTIDTVKREFEEELGVKIIDSQIELFSLGITNVQGKKRSCKIHYDFWYLVHTPKLNFKYDKKEFYQAEWLTLENAVKKTTHTSVIKILSKLKKSIHRL